MWFQKLYLPLLWLFKNFVYFYFYLSMVSPWNQTQVIGLSCKCLCALSHLTGQAQSIVFQCKDSLFVIYYISKCFIGNCEITWWGMKIKEKSYSDFYNLLIQSYWFSLNISSIKCLFSNLWPLHFLNIVLVWPGILLPGGILCLLLRIIFLKFICDHAHCFLGASGS